MPRFESDSDARRLGEALAALRRDRALSQAEAGRGAGMTSQGWGLYETGKRSGLFRPDVQRRLTAAIGATPEDLLQRQDAP
ncbi:MAG: helix-turn-helix transcriptional regulator, partial [Brevundimonas sp.]|nr:helix-turn-helix transcriptional regulator [Brevundimonas sp.]